MVLRRSFINSPDYIQSLDRGLQVLRAFNRERPRCTLSDIAAQIGLSRAVGGQIGQRTRRLVARKYFSPDDRAHDLQAARVASGNSESAPPRLRVRLARAGVGTVLNSSADSFRNRSGGVRS